MNDARQFVVMDGETWEADGVDILCGGMVTARVVSCGDEEADHWLAQSIAKALNHVACINGRRTDHP